MGFKFIITAVICCFLSLTSHGQKWIHLFNGKDLNNWTVKISKHKLNDNFEKTFQVKDSLLTIDYSGYISFDEQYGHIFYKKPYAYYVLEIEYRFIGEQISGGPGWAFKNSGVMIHSQNPKTMLVDQDFPISIEAQFLGGEDKGLRTTSNVCTPGTTIEINDKLITAHCVNSSSKNHKSTEWIKAHLIVLGDSSIEHVIDKEVVLSYTKPKIGGGNVSNYEPKIKIDGTSLNNGFIALQSESHPIQFKTVKLLNLKKHKNNLQKINQILKSYQIK